MLRIYTILILGLWIALNSTTFAQLVITNGATLTINTGETVTLSGINLQNNAGGTITHNGTFLILGNATDRDIINHGTFNGNAGTIEMKGINEQQVQGNTLVDIGTLIVDNGGNGVSIANTGGIKIHNALTLTNGHLFTNNNSPVIFTPTAANPVETNANHIKGTAIMESRNVNTSAVNFLMFQMAAGADVGNLTLTRYSGDGSTTSRSFNPTNATVNAGSYESIDTYWVVDVTNTSGTRNVTWSWLPAWDNGKTLTQMQIWKSDQTPATWILHNTNTHDLSTRSYSETINLSALNKSWTFSDILNPLPVDLVSFLVRLSNGNALITWKTHNEYQLKGYIVERSIDNLNFQPIAFVDAKNQLRNDYTHIDYEAQQQGKPIVYYRLRIQERDGSSRTTPSQAVHFAPTEDLIVNIYPNPFQDELNVRIPNPEKHEIHIRLVDMTGKVLAQTTSQDEDVQHTIIDRVGSLATGTYFVQVERNGKAKVFKVIKKQ